MRRIKQSLNLLKNNSFFSVIMSLICIAFFSLLFIVINFITIMNPKIVKNVYGNVDFETMIFNCNYSDVNNFKDYYIRSTIGDKVYIDGESINNYAFSYYNANYIERKKIEVNEGVIISKNISEAFSLGINDKINLSFGKTTEELIITSILEDDIDEINFYFPADLLEKYEGDVSFVVSFADEDLKDICSKIKEYNPSNIKDYDYVFSFLETIKTIRIIFILVLFLIDVIICYTLYKIVSVLVSKREKEIGIRFAIGYRKKDLIIIYSFSTLIIVIVAAISSCFLAVPTYYYLLKQINAMMKINISMNFNYLLAFSNVIIICIICMLFMLIAFRKTFNKKIINMIRGCENV